MHQDDISPNGKGTLLSVLLVSPTTRRSDRHNYSHVFFTSLPFSLHSLIAIYLEINQCNLSSCPKDTSEFSPARRQIIIKHHRVCSAGTLIPIPLQVQDSHELVLYHWSVAADLKKPTLSRPQWKLLFFFCSTCHMACQMLNPSVKSFQP